MLKVGPLDGISDAASRGDCLYEDQGDSSGGREEAEEEEVGIVERGTRSELESKNRAKGMAKAKAKMATRNKSLAISDQVKNEKVKNEKEKVKNEKRSQRNRKRPSSITQIDRLNFMNFCIHA